MFFLSFLKFVVCSFLYFWTYISPPGPESHWDWCVEIGCAKSATYSASGQDAWNFGRCKWGPRILEKGEREGNPACERGAFFYCFLFVLKSTRILIKSATFRSISMRNIMLFYCFRAFLKTRQGFSSKVQLLDRFWWEAYFFFTVFAFFLKNVKDSHQKCNF